MTFYFTMTAVFLDEHPVIILSPHPNSAITKRNWGGQVICSLAVMQLRNKDEQKILDVLIPAMPDLTSASHILIFTGKVKNKMLLFSASIVISTFCIYILS